MELNTGNRDMSWRQYAVVALGFILVMFLLSLDRGSDDASMRQTETSVNEVMQGDLQVKFYFFSQYAAKTGVGVPQWNAPGKILPRALAFYESASSRPSPAAIRRAGVMSYELRREGALGYLTRLSSPEALRGLPPQDARKLRNEARMWADIYSGELDARDVDEYAERIREVNLGPVRAFALEHLYNRARQPERAREAILEAESRAADSLVPYGVLMLILILAGLAGIVFIGLFIKNRRDWLSRRGQGPVTEPEFTLSKALFRGFIAYLAITLMLGVIANLFFLPLLENLPSERRLVFTVMLQFGIIAASGLIGLGVLYYLLKQIGRNLGEIGLSTLDFGKNVLWGIGGYCAVLPLLYSAAWISNVLLKGVETPVNPVVPWLTAGNSTVIVFVVLLATVLAPVFEEIFFRGALYNGLRARMTVAGAVILSSAAFALIHPFPGSFLSIFAIATVFAVLYEIRGSLVPPMVAHAINNTVMFLMVYLIQIG